MPRRGNLKLHIAQNPAGALERLHIICTSLPMNGQHGVDVLPARLFELASGAFDVFKIFRRPDPYATKSCTKAQAEFR